MEWPGAGRHPAVIVTRQVAIPALTSVAVALITSTVRGLRSEVPLGEAQGLEHECVANCDNLLTVPKSALVSYRGRLDAPLLARLNDALRIALELDA